MYSVKYPSRCLLGVHYELVKNPFYKYRIIKETLFKTDIIGFEIDHEFFQLSADGTLTIKVGYMSDGPSGWTIDTSSFMRASFFHDALYQMMRECLIPKSSENFDKYRKKADKLLAHICKIDGMILVRRMWVYSFVRIGGKSSAVPQ